MKFMKLGSQPDTFYTTETMRSVTSEVSTDVILQVNGSTYLLHKFPLLSKCQRLQRLGWESSSLSLPTEIELTDFPGGVEAFEVCVKFCYGMTITLSAYNIVSIRCAAEYLQMKEDVDKGNLIQKLEIFFTSCILHGWKDSILTLQTTKSFHVWSEDLGWTASCIDSIASKVIQRPILSHSSSKAWWAEDIAELGIDLYWRTMIAIKSPRKVPVHLIAEALRVYASRWLPNVSKYIYMDVDGVGEVNSKHRILLESIISLLPVEKGAVCCSLLSKLLKAANIVKASESSKAELVTRIGVQLEDAAVCDLLVPSSSNGIMSYDVDVVLNILQIFMLQGQSPPTSPPRNSQRRRSRSAEDIGFDSHSSKLRVAKLVDGYLQEIAKDKNLSMSKFVEIAQAVPEFARVEHDDLYKAIDIYLKEHEELSKSERKRLCRILDCKRLSVEACMHAAQNEMLPLRVVVQVLFFEQARATTANGKVSELPTNIKALLSGSSMPKTSFSTNATTIPLEDQWSVSGLKSLPTLKMKLAEEDCVAEESTKTKYLSMSHNRPKRLFSKLWPLNRSASEKN